MIVLISLVNLVEQLLVTLLGKCLGDQQSLVKEEAHFGVFRINVEVGTKVTEGDGVDGLVVLGLVGCGRGTSTVLFAFCSRDHLCGSLCCSLDLCIHISVVLVPRGYVMGV